MQINNSNNLYSQYNNNKQLTGMDKGQTKSVNEIVKESIEKAYEYTEEEEKQLNESINQKLKSGAKLTPGEMRYLQKTNPILYKKVLAIQMKREMLEKKLKNCKSKQEVDKVISMEVSLIKKNDPDKDMKLKSILDTEKEFKKTNHYKRLPERVKKDDKGNSEKK